MQKLSLWSFALLASALSTGGALLGGTISETYSFIGSAKDVVIANGFLTADGVGSGSLNELDGVVFDTYNHINLTTLQNFGTFTLLFPDGDTAFGILYEDDVKVSLSTFSGPFTQILTVTSGSGAFAGASGTLTGGGFIYPTYYSTSGTGTLTAPGLFVSPEPGSGVLLLIGLAAAAIGGINRKCGFGKPA